MKAIKKAAVLTATTCALVLASAAGASADAGAHGAAAGSPGVLSGNVVQIPVNIPINVCGNSIDIIGLLNPAAGNACVHKGDPIHGHDKASDPGAFSGDKKGKCDPVHRMDRPAPHRMDPPAPHRVDRPAPDRVDRPAVHAHLPAVHRPARHHARRLVHHRLHRLHRPAHHRPARHHVQGKHHR